jgi:formate hydrogenlyase subunit 3/multisubunit Na+/H+ antiporter MnhD subunit
MGKLTLDIILSIGICVLAIMHHLHDIQQIILLQLLKPIGQLFHINILLSSAAFLLVTACCLLCCAVFADRTRYGEEF